MLPKLEVDLAGRTIDLTNVSVRAKQPSGEAGHRDGVLAVDGLADGFTLDFRAMQLRLE